MVLTEAIRTAKTEHVVYFLLAAYVETLDYFDPLRSSLPESVKKLPIDGKADVVERLRALRAVAYEHAHGETRSRLLLDEAADVFTSASQRLRALQNTHHDFRRKSDGLLAGELRARSSRLT